MDRYVMAGIVASLGNRHDIIPALPQATQSLALGVRSGLPQCVQGGS
jgi:hypothetical protein